MAQSPGLKYYQFSWEGLLWDKQPFHFFFFFQLEYTPSGFLCCPFHICGFALVLLPNVLKSISSPSDGEDSSHTLPHSLKTKQEKNPQNHQAVVFNCFEDILNCSCIWYFNGKLWQHALTRICYSDFSWHLPVSCRSSWQTVKPRGESSVLRRATALIRPTAECTSLCAPVQMCQPCLSAASLCFPRRIKFASGLIWQALRTLCCVLQTRIFSCSALRKTI